MASPLRLRSEKVGKPEIARSKPVVSVLVDTGVYHLDDEYDYLLPDKYDLNPGDWVSVPFKGRNCLGLIVNRTDKSNFQKLEFINRPAKAPHINVEFIALYRAISGRWAVPIFDVLRFVAKAKKDLIETENNSSIGAISNKLGNRVYVQLKANHDEISQVRDYVEKISQTGPTLLIVPEARSYELLKSDSYTIAMRSGILLPKKFTNLIVLREDSEHHYEIRSPGFNTRDIALLRNEKLGEKLLFLGFSPSVEMMSMIEKGYVSLKPSAGRLSVIAKPSLQGELIPSALVSKFRERLKVGPVLVLVPNKGYGLAISCAKCRNIAKCGCGGRLTKKSKTAEPSCFLCNREFANWRCVHCDGHELWLIGRGIERIAEEFGRSFPNTPIHISTAEKRIEGSLNKRSIVLSTYGAAPIQLFSSVLFLEGFHLSADIRSSERALSNLFRYSSLSQGAVLIVDRPESPFVTALARWNPFSFLRKDLEELKSANLPPYRRHLILKSDNKEIPKIFNGIQSAMREGRLKRSISIYNHEDLAISIFFSLRDAKEVLDFFFQFQRRRSMAGKKPLNLRVDPYLLG